MSINSGDRPWPRVLDDEGVDWPADEQRILVPVAKGPHSGLATRTAEAIARASDCWIELFHVVEAAEPAAEIIKHAGYHEVTVLGAPEKGRLRRFLFGSTTDEVEQDGESGPVRS